MKQKLSTNFLTKSRVDFIIDDELALSWLAEFKSDLYERFFVFIDRNVKTIWGDKIFEKLKKHNKKIFVHKVEPKEKSKSLSYYPAAVKFLEKEGAGRFDLVIGIGGGIVLDLVCFVASTYMRGLPLYLIPTTLIGQIDASTAGKTCLNTESTKNLLGTFYYPLKVYNNINFLKTCKEYYHRQGLSEVFKYGLLNNPELLSLLNSKKQGNAVTFEIIERAIKTRVAIRKKHPLASNLGHTFGHAIEKLSNFNILHGDAINIGTIISLYFAQSMNIIKKEDVEEIIGLMKQVGLNLYFDKDVNISRFVNLMLRDKKSSSNYLNLVLIKGIGQPYEKRGSLFYKTKPEIVAKFLKKFALNYKYSISDCANFIKRAQLTY